LTKIICLIKNLIEDARKYARRNSRCCGNCRYLTGDSCVFRVPGMGRYDVCFNWESRKEGQ
jgi:hypothetical protein